MTVTDVYNPLKHLKQSRARDLDGLDTKLLRLAAPVILGSVLWDSASKNCLKPLQGLYKRSLKLILLKQPSLEQDDYDLLSILQVLT